MLSQKVDCDDVTVGRRGEGEDGSGGWARVMCVSPLLNRPPLVMFPASLIV